MQQLKELQFEPEKISVLDRIRFDSIRMLGALSEGFYPRSENGQRPGDEVVSECEKKYN